MCMCMHVCVCMRACVRAWCVGTCMRVRLFKIQYTDVNSTKYVHARMYSTVRARAL